MVVVNIILISNCCVMRNWVNWEEKLFLVEEFCEFWSWWELLIMVLVVVKSWGLWEDLKVYLVFCVIVFVWSLLYFLFVEGMCKNISGYVV